jgi:hypothetical protein
MNESDELTRRLSELVATPPMEPDIEAAVRRGARRRRFRNLVAMTGAATVLAAGVTIGAHLLPTPARTGGGTLSVVQPAAPRSTGVSTPAPTPSSTPTSARRHVWTKGQTVPFTPVLTGSHVAVGKQCVNFRLEDGTYLNGGPCFVPGNTPVRGARAGDAQQAAAIGFTDGVATAIAEDAYYHLVSGLAPAGTGDIIVRGNLGEVRTHPLPVPGTTIRAWVVPDTGVASNPDPQPTAPVPYTPDYIIAE